MACVEVCTPRQARGRLANWTTPSRLLPSKSPSTPSRPADVAERTHESIHRKPSEAATPLRSVTKSLKSPKVSILRLSTPHRVQAQPSEWALTGTSASTKPSPTKSRRNVTCRPRAEKSRISYKSADRFIPNRTASQAISGNVKMGMDSRPKSSSSAGDGSSVLASAATALSGRAADDDAGLSLEGLSLHDDDDDEATSHSRPSPNSVAYQSSLASACGVSENTRILAFKPAPPESTKPIDLRSQYNRPLKPAAGLSAQFRRRIATAPERVLDAPNLVDDYYLNLLDWSCGNQIAIGLERQVYIWSAETGTVNPLFEASADTYVSSVKWSTDGAYVGVGLGTGEVQIWDVEEQTKIRSMIGHETRVGVMGWNKHLLSTGARSGLVFNHDVRIAQHKIAELASHTGEVCGLEWRSDGAQLATGGNDNLVSIWDARHLAAPKFAKTNHHAAVKAVAWCPWQGNLLATGGGSHDRHIHFWNSTSGARTASIDTGSQVTGLRWSRQQKEIVSTSGFPDNSLSIWSYPTLVKHAEIPAHESRILHSTLSPDGEMLATAAADESLKFWRVFEGEKKKGRQATAGKASMAAQMVIR